MKRYIGTIDGRVIDTDTGETLNRYTGEDRHGKAIDFAVWLNDTTYAVNYL